ncbi:MAG: ATP/GTP-binding protein [Acidimicrobiia bacterium]|nr:ATP/GTP-binding protein [Acidimicrobiia bacterium]
MAPERAFGELGELVVSFVQPYQARKRYQCPGCSGWIEPGVGHLVVVPEMAADLRRHWHRGCWWKEQRRLGAITAAANTPQAGTSPAGGQTPPPH